MMGANDNPTAFVARRALAISFALTSLLGAVTLAVRWSAHGPLAYQRPALFVAIMLAIHVAGYLAYQHQPAVRQGRPLGVFVVISPLYRQPIIWAAVQQLLAGLFVSLLLCDCGRILLPAAAGHWLSLLLMIVRRPANPTRDDLIFICYGFWVCVSIAIGVALLVARLY